MKLLDALRGPQGAPGHKDLPIDTWRPGDDGDDHVLAPTAGLLPIPEDQSRQLPRPAPRTARTASPLRLSWARRLAVRRHIRAMAMLCVQQRALMHYTQGWRRWDGIRLRIRWPHHASFGDCSAFVTWLFWESTRAFGLGDFVNGADWRAGYTGTMTKHGVVVPATRGRLLVGDALFYGGTSDVPEHTAIYVGRGMVVSFGSEAGPMYLPFNYRPVNHARRYVR